MLVTRTQLEGNNPLKTNVVIGQFESGDRLDFLERATTMQGFILECIICCHKGSWSSRGFYWPLLYSEVLE